MATKQLPEGSFSITNGPSKFDLMTSLFDGKVVGITCDIAPQIGTIKISPVLKVIFFTIGIEDGSHDSWIGTISFTDEFYETERRKFYYSSKNRKGHIFERSRS